MSQGTVYHRNTGRENVLRAIVSTLNLDVKFSEPDDQYYSLFPLNKVPGYVHGNFVLHETVAIARYLSSLSKDSTLFGTSAQSEAQVLQWFSFANEELNGSLKIAILMIRGLTTPYNQKAVDTALANADKYADVFESHFKKNTYLVGERVTAADFYTASVVYKGFKFFWNQAWANKHPNITRWFKTIVNQKPLSQFLSVEICTEPVKFTPPKKENKKKESKPTAPKAEKKPVTPKPKAKDNNDEEEAAPTEKKPVHPLSLLPKPKMVLDDWKRCYSNEDTRTKALPWFWQHFNDSNPEDYSLWKVAYKYNDELTLTFMSNNLVGGFFNRLTASTKYLFGCMVVYGENNNNGIVGVFLVRGQDYKPAFDVAPDWESYEFTKLEPAKNEHDKEYVDDLWAWDKPVVVDGEKKEIADGKVFK